MCGVYGEEDTIRQALNVYKMRLLGAEVVPVTSGTATLKMPYLKRCVNGRAALKIPIIVLDP